MKKHVQPVEIYRKRKTPFYLQRWAWVLLGLMGLGVIVGIARL